MLFLQRVSYHDCDILITIVDIKEIGNNYNIIVYAIGYYIFT